MVWLHITRGDVAPPGTSVLARVHDPRAAQFWDPERLLPDTLARDLPPAMVAAVADTDAAGHVVIWDYAALFRPGVRWEGRLPAPDWQGSPVVDALDSLRARLAPPPRR